MHTGSIWPRLRSVDRTQCQCGRIWKSCDFCLLFIFFLTPLFILIFSFEEQSLRRLINKPWIDESASNHFPVGSIVKFICNIAKCPHVGSGSHAHEQSAPLLASPQSITRTCNSIVSNQSLMRYYFSVSIRLLVSLEFASWNSLLLFSQNHVFKIFSYPFLILRVIYLRVFLTFYFHTQLLQKEIRGFSAAPNEMR